MEDKKGSLRSSVDTVKSREDLTIETIRSLVDFEASNSPSSNFHSPNKEFYLPGLIELEYKALETGEMRDAIAVWSIPLYAQRKYWFKLFIGFNYGIFAVFLTNWTMRGIPDPTFSGPTLRLYEYLGKNAGIQSMEEVLGEFKLKSLRKHLKAKPTVESIPVTRRVAESIRSVTPIKSLKSRLSWDSFHLGLRRTSNNLDICNLVATAEEENPLTEDDRQSKLSQEQLSELQRSTHFDKKELQQWYKGMFRYLNYRPAQTHTKPPRFPEGLPLRHAHQGRIPEDLPTILPFRRPLLFR
jgi:hypothetical protein